MKLYAPPSPLRSLCCSVIYLMLTFSLFSSSNDDRVLILMIFTLLTLLSLMVVIGCLSCILLTSPPDLQVISASNSLYTFHPSPLQAPCDPWLPDSGLTIVTSAHSTPVHEFDFGFGLVLSPARPRRCSNLYNLNTLDKLYHKYLFTLNILGSLYNQYLYILCNDRFALIHTY